MRYLCIEYRLVFIGIYRLKVYGRAIIIILRGLFDSIAPSRI